MRKNDKKVFLNKEKLTEMLNLRINGYAIRSLATKYGVDTSSIRYQCDKYLINPMDEEVYDVGRIVSQVLPQPRQTYKIVSGEKINLGKSYTEYLEASGISPYKNLLG